MHSSLSPFPVSYLIQHFSPVCECGTRVRLGHGLLVIIPALGGWLAPTETHQRLVNHSLPASCGYFVPVTLASVGTAFLRGSGFALQLAFWTVFCGSVGGGAAWHPDRG